MKKIILSLICLFSLLSFSTSFAQEEDFVPSAEIVVHLLDYLAKDYGGAVQNGKIIHQGEYDEQVEFIGIVLKNSQGVDSLREAQFIQGVQDLEKIIFNKGEADDVSALARKLQQDAISLAPIQVSPTILPDLSLGKTLYQQSCVSCHGETGRGDGVAGAYLDPAPTNFHDEEVVWESSAYKFYNTIRLGVPGTGMVAFSDLSDQEVWSLAYYIKSLSYEGVPQDIQQDIISATELATLTDEEIVEKLGGKTPENIKVLGALRASGTTGDTDDPISIAKNLLNKSLNFAREGNYSQAQTHAINAYLQGIEPIEPKMKANLPGYVEQIEGLMADFRSLVSKKSSPDILEVKKSEIFIKLDEAQTYLAENTMSAWVAFVAAFSIFLREGFEAVLIIIVLISILRSMKQPEAIKWVHLGWAVALGLGIISWFASGVLMKMSGMSRELMEGAISLLAVAVLIYVGFWLHRYSEIKKWHAYLQEKLKHGLNHKSYIGLALVSFFAVFREAFEVVLFLRAIWMDLDSQGQSIAGLGVLSSLVILLGLSYFAIKESKKIPTTRLFQLCSWTMVVLAVILAGKGVHSLQEAGFISVKTLSLGMRSDLLGIYPNAQTTLAQIFVILLFAGLFLSEKFSKKTKAAH